MSLSDKVKSSSEQVSGAIIPINAFVQPSGATFIKGTLSSTLICGVNGRSGAVPSGKRFKLIKGDYCNVTSASDIPIGSLLKCGTNGTAVPLVTSVNASKLIKTCTAGAGFSTTNQPQNDDITVVSNNNTATDKGQIITLICTTTATNTVVEYQLTLNGTTAVSTNADCAPAGAKGIGYLLAIKISAPVAGTLTFAEASASQTIITMSPAESIVGSLGVQTVAAGTQGAYNSIPSVTPSGTSARTIGIKYVPTDETAQVQQSIAIASNTKTAFPTAALRVTEVYTGDLEAARTCTINASATVDTLDKKCGRALEAATAAGQTIAAYVYG
jgi:hypothetical protein